MKAVITIFQDEESVNCQFCLYLEIFGSEYSCGLFNQELIAENRKPIRCLSCVQAELDYKLLAEKAKGE